jgi:hypothetical protein
MCQTLKGDARQGNNEGATVKQLVACTELLNRCSWEAIGSFNTAHANSGVVTDEPALQCDQGHLTTSYNQPTGLHLTHYAMYRPSQHRTAQRSTSH